MDITFKCPHCDQELEVDSTGAGSSIDCPSCARSIMVPVSEHENGEVVAQAAPAAAGAAGAASAPAKVERHFTVPTHHSGPAEALIQKPNRPLEIAAKDCDKKVRIKTFKHTDCVEVGKDRFDEVISNFLDKVGWDNVISVTPVTYSYVQLDTRANISDYGVLVVYRG
jgi:transcription elongation factor Elf1